MRSGGNASGRSFSQLGGRTAQVGNCAPDGALGVYLSHLQCPAVHQSFVSLVTVCKFLGCAPEKR